MKKVKMVVDSLSTSTKKRNKKVRETKQRQLDKKYVREQLQ